MVQQQQQKKRGKGAIAMAKPAVAECVGPACSPAVNKYLGNLYSIPGVVVGYVESPEMVIPNEKKLKLLFGVSRPTSMAGRDGRPSLYFSENREEGALRRCSSPDGVSGRAAACGASPASQLLPSGPLVATPWGWAPCHPPDGPSRGWVLGAG